MEETRSTGETEARPPVVENYELSISTIIPTVGRSSLSKAIKSTLEQDAPNVFSEVVVVNDSGQPLENLSDEYSGRLRVISTGGARTGQTAARNLGAQHARGDFLHFLDDDDWMHSGAFEAFRATHRNCPEAKWLYGTIRRVTREGEPYDILPTDVEGNVLAETISGEWMPLQATLIHRDLFNEVGGFDPFFVVSEDIDLLFRLGLTEDLVRVPHVVCTYSLGNDQSATQRERGDEYRAKAYEKLFDLPGSTGRAIGSAQTPYLSGQVMRQYLISLRRNVRQGQVSKAIQRLASATRTLAGIHVFDGLFWRALLSKKAGMKPHT